MFFLADTKQANLSKYFPPKFWRNFIRMDQKDKIAFTNMVESVEGGRSSKSLGFDEDEEKGFKEFLGSIVGDFRKQESKRIGYQAL